MIEAGDFRNGVTVEIDGQVFQIIWFQHVKPGKGSAFVKTKMRNILKGGVVERTFSPEEKFPPANIDRKDMQYSWKDGDMYMFMDLETGDTIGLSEELAADAMKYVKEGETCRICSFKGNVFSVEPPMFVELEITDTEPGVRGDTATNVTKPAITETGAEIKVPIFINIGDKIQIDTREGGSYLKRV